MVIARSRRIRSRQKRRGSAFVLVLATVVLLLGMGCLMVDFGYLTAVKSRVQSTADAASMAGALRLRSQYDFPVVSDINSMAIKYAEYNQPLTQGILAASDIEIGVWNADAGAFTKGGFDTNAVRVTIRRDSQSTPVGLFLANVFGKQSCDVSASAICTFKVTQDEEGNDEMSRPCIVQ